MAWNLKENSITNGEGWKENYSPVFLPPQEPTSQIPIRPGWTTHMETSWGWCGFSVNIVPFLFYSLEFSWQAKRIDMTLHLNQTKVILRLNPCLNLWIVSNSAFHKRGSSQMYQVYEKRGLVWVYRRGVRISSVSVGREFVIIVDSVKLQPSKIMENILICSCESSW